MFIKKYDKEHDVLHVYLSERANERYSSATEEAPDIYILRDDETGNITGFKFLNYKAKGIDNSEESLRLPINH